jgi:hypothetical protein
MPKLLFFLTKENIKEYEITLKYFDVITQRMSLPYVYGGKWDKEGIVARHIDPSNWYYKELEKDIIYFGDRLITPFSTHLFLNDIGQWYETVKEYTPRTWTLEEFYRDWNPDAFDKMILRAEDSSFKNKFNATFFAYDEMTRRELVRLASHITDKKLYIREYIELENYTTDVLGNAIGNEHRVFMYGEKILSHGYYWVNFEEEVKKENNGYLPILEPSAFKLINNVAKKIRERIGYVFYTMDIAKTEKGEWILIEINNGCCSGIQGCNPEDLYANLAKELGC